METRKERSKIMSTGKSPGSRLDDLNRLAKSEMERLDGRQPYRRGVVAGIVIGSLLFLLSGFGWYRLDYQPGLQQQICLHSLVSGFTSAHALPGSLSTAGEVAGELSTSPPESGASELVAPPVLEVRQNFFIPLVSRGPTACRQVEEIQLAVLSGPLLDPPSGTKLKSDQSADAQATWVIQNLGSCQWESLALYSLHDAAQMDPQLRRDGVVLDVGSMQVLNEPGGSLEVIAIFPVDQAQRIQDEWVLVINGHQLFARSHLGLNVSQWVTVQRSARENTAQQPVGPAPTGDPDLSGDSPVDRGSEPPLPTRQASYPPPSRP
jgi:hypothetical protein